MRGLIIMSRLLAPTAAILLCAVAISKSDRALMTENGPQIFPHSVNSDSTGSIGLPDSTRSYSAHHREYQRSLRDEYLGGRGSFISELQKQLFTREQMLADTDRGIAAWRESGRGDLPLATRDRRNALDAEIRQYREQISTVHQAMATR
jgi:hypothetical protein